MRQTHIHNAAIKISFRLFGAQMFYLKKSKFFRKQL